MEEPENDKVEGGRVSIDALMEDCVKEIGKSEDDKVDEKLKKTFLKRLEDVFSCESGVKDAYSMNGICLKELWFAVYVDVGLAFFSKERK